MALLNSFVNSVPPCEILKSVLSLRLSRVLLGCLLLVAVPGSLVSQETSDTMVLLKGPYQEQGLPFLPRDISTNFRGEYLYKATTVSFFFLQRPLADEADWQNGGCTFETRVLRDPQLGMVYYLPFRDGESIAAIVPEKTGLDICALLDSFRRRFSYFLNTSRQWILPPFPGVVEISSSQSP